MRARIRASSTESSASRSRFRRRPSRAAALLRRRCARFSSLESASGGGASGRSPSAPTSEGARTGDSVSPMSESATADSARRWCWWRFSARWASPGGVSPSSAGDGAHTSPRAASSARRPCSRSSCADSAAFLLLRERRADIAFFRRRRRRRSSGGRKRGLVSRDSGAGAGAPGVNSGAVPGVDSTPAGIGAAVTRGILA